MKKFLSIIFIIFVSVILSFAANIEWWRKAAEQGYAQAQCNLGISYANGDGVEKNPTEAVKWWRKAAEQGYAQAQFNLGICYDFGDGVEKNPTEAVKWYRKAAEQGYAQAQFNLGVCYYNGQGMIQNNIKAYAWIAVASANGDDQATKVLQLLKEKMTPLQIERALSLAENYSKGIFDETPRK